MHATDIIAYAYNANTWCPACVKDVPDSDNTEEGKCPIFADQASEWTEQGLYCYGCNEEIIEQEQTEMEPIEFTWTDHHQSISGVQDGLTRGTGKVGNFEIVVDISYDHDHDFTEGRGQFTSQIEDQTTLKNPRAKYDHGAFEYFQPDISVSELIREFKRAGHSVQEARKRAVAQMKEIMQVAAEPSATDYIAVYVVAHVLYKFKGSNYVANIELGRDSLCGIETDASNVLEDEYIKQVVQECAVNAIGCAYAAIQALHGEDTEPLSAYF